MVYVLMNILIKANVQFGIWIILLSDQHHSHACTLIMDVQPVISTAYS